MYRRRGLAPRLAQVAAAVLLACGGCGGFGKGSERPAEIAESLVGSIEELASAVEGASDEDRGAGPDAAACDAFAARLSTWLEREGEDLQRRVAAVREGAPRLAPGERERLKRRLTPALAVLLRRAAACEGHENARRAFEKLDRALDAP